MRRSTPARTLHAAWLASLLCLIPATVQLTAQVETQTAPVTLGRSQPLYFSALNFGQMTEFGMNSRIDVYVHVPFDIITFVRKEEAYVGSYTVSVLVSDEDGNRIKEESWDRTIEKTTFESTVNPALYDLTQRSITLEPGAVVLEVLYEDRASKKEFRLSRKIQVRKFDRNLFGMSDIMLARQVETKEGRKVISPQIDPNIAGLAGGVNLFYEVYNPLQVDKIRLSYVVQRQGKVLMSNSEVQPIQPGTSTFLTHVSTSTLPIGPYTIDLTISRIEDTTSAGVLAHASASFVMEWLSGGAPVSISDLEEAIDQMRYFAKSDDISWIREPKSEDERRKRFEEFWEKNNPIPGSKPNRALVEYYSRVAYANEHFKHYIDGWKTDRGMVYIIYGVPSYVDRHPLDVESKPYEIWEYYDIQRRFVFVDDSGFGDYRLLYPIWDDRNRLR